MLGAARDVDGAGPGKPADHYLPTGEDAPFLLDLMEKSKPIFADHPVNELRRKAGDTAATQIWLWGHGPRPTLPLLPLLFALLSAVLFALGWRWMPERRRRTYAYAGFLTFVVLAVAIAGCGGGGGGGGGHTVTIKASYVGDSNYAASSGNTNVTVQ